MSEMGTPRRRTCWMSVTTSLAPAPLSRAFIREKRTAACSRANVELSRAFGAPAVVKCTSTVSLGGDPHAPPPARPLD